jgi:hypothetical protein
MFLKTYAKAKAIKLGHLILGHPTQIIHPDFDA